MEKSHPQSHTLIQMQIPSSGGFNSNNSPSTRSKIPTASGSSDAHLNPAVCILLDDFKWFRFKKHGHQITDPNWAPSDPGGSLTLRLCVKTGIKTVVELTWSHCPFLSSVSQTPSWYVFSVLRQQRERGYEVSTASINKEVQGFYGVLSGRSCAAFQADPNMPSWSEQMESRPRGAQGIFQRCKIH